MMDGDGVLSFFAGVLFAGVLSITAYFVGVSDGSKSADKRWQVEAVNHRAGQMIVPEGEYAFVFKWNDELSECQRGCK